MWLRSTNPFLHKVMVPLLPIVRSMRILLLILLWVCLRNRSSNALFLPSSTPPTHRWHRDVSVASRMIAPQQLGSFEALVLEDDTPRRVRCYDYTATNGPIEYHAAWTLQKELLQAHLDRLARPKDNEENTVKDDDETFLQQRGGGDGIDTIVLLEHTPVYTLGTGSDASFIHATQQPVPVVRMDRGGEVTYHGPGQLTVYPILDLHSYRPDIHWYVRALEEVVVRAIAQLAQDRPARTAHREPDVTGVWIDDCKVAAVGVKCRKWITQHGFAVNVTPESMRYMDGIVPCGLVGRKVGYVQQFLLEEEPITVAEMALYVRAALEDVFQIQLVDAGELPCLSDPDI